MNLEFKTLEETELQSVLYAFNKSFSDYIIPFQLNLDQLTSKMYIENIDLNYSVGAFENGKLIAFILHGTKMIENSINLYNAGTGVIPTYRDNRLTYKMYAYLIPKLKTRKVSKIQLEVISDNLPAIKSYEKTGFKIERKLNCYKSRIPNLQVNTDINIIENQSPDWSQLQLFWDTLPTWQNSIESISRLEGSLLIIGAFKGNEIIGYLALNKKNNRILQLAVEKKYRRQKVGSTLLAYLSKNHSNLTSIINVDAEDKAANSFFIKCGFEKTLEQNEMVLIIED